MQIRHELTRIEPLMAPAAYKTYSVVMPLATHWRPGTCDEAHCPDFVYGWRTVVDEATDLGRRQAHYIRHDQTRARAEERDETGLLTVFTFGPGQPCFVNPPTGPGHQVPLQRDPRFLVRGGDWRGNPSGVGPRFHTRAEDWVDDFATHQQMLADQIGKG